VLTAGVPGPWSEAAKGLFHVKRIPYTAVAQEGGGENAELRAWTGHDNAPIVVHADEPPRTRWDEIIFFAERLAPEPALIPADPADRALMFGLCHEICGENGLGWSRRLMIIHEALAIPALADSPAGDGVRRLGRKYGYSPEAAEAAPPRSGCPRSRRSDPARTPRPHLQRLPPASARLLRRARAPGGFAGYAAPIC